MLPPTSGPTPALQLHQGFQVNILSTSLVARLKQTRQVKSHMNCDKPPRLGGLKQRNRKLSRSLKQLGDMDGENDNDGDDFENVVDVEFHTQSREGLAPSSTIRSRSGITQRRTGSASSDGASTQLPALNSASARSQSSSRIGSRRSLSASRATDVGRGAGRKSAGACVTPTRFISRAMNYPVNVVKKDGVFQPADKYTSGRVDMRDGGGHTSLWDYHTYILPAVDTASSNGDGPGSPRLSEHGGDSPRSVKKRMKVSWKGGPYSQDEHNQAERVTSSEWFREATATPSASGVPSTPMKQRRAHPEDNFAFKRPVYSSGRSCVGSIGLHWQIPIPGDVEPDSSGGEPPKRKSSTEQSPATTAATTSSKPMWSYLITNDSKPQPHHNPKTTPTATDTKTTAAGKEQRKSAHRRDVHPVSTALQKTGRSVSMTRWAVPSSSASGLDAERAVRDRLQLVHHPDGSRLLKMNPSGVFTTSNSAARRFRKAMVAAGREEEIEEDQDKENFHAEEFHFPKRIPLRGSGKSRGVYPSPASGARVRSGKEEEYIQRTTTGTNDDKATSTCEDDRLSSPAKSRSTFYN